jgi:hypothetical protein
MEKFGSGIRDKHPGSATLFATSSCLTDSGLELFGDPYTKDCTLYQVGSDPDSLNPNPG